MKRAWTLILIVSVLSCQKAQRDEDTAVNTCEDISLAQTIFGDAYKQIRTAALSAKGISNSDSSIVSIYGCEEIKIDTLSNPRNIIIDYKYIGCEGLGIERNGRLLADFQGLFTAENSAVDIEFSNYFFNGYEVNGKIRVIFKARNSEGKEVHTFYLQDGSVNDGTNILSWTASQTWTVTSEADSPESFSITGNNNGINRKGNMFTSEITSAVDMSEDCLYPMKGKLTVDVRNLSLRSLDYGNGACDRKAEAAINGATYSVIIP